MFVYLDDTLIFSPDEDPHVLHVNQVLQSLFDNQLFVKAEKCQFHVSTVSFLGFIMYEGEVRMDPEKVQVLEDSLIPSTHQFHYRPVTCLNPLSSLTSHGAHRPTPPSND